LCWQGENGAILSEGFGVVFVVRCFIELVQGKAGVAGDGELVECCGCHGLNGV
jgi:hypothetical protein